MAEKINRPLLVYKLPAEIRKGLDDKLRRKLLSLRVAVWRLTKQYETVPLDKSVYLIMNKDDVPEIDRELQTLKDEYRKIGFPRAVLFVGVSEMSEANFKDNFLYHFEQKLGEMDKEMTKKGSITDKTLEDYKSVVVTIEKVMADFKITDKAVSHLLVVTKDLIEKREKQIGKSNADDEREWV